MGEPVHGGEGVGALPVMTEDDDVVEDDMVKVVSAP